MTLQEAPSESAGKDRKDWKERESDFFTKLKALQQNPQGSERAKLSRLRRAVGGSIATNVWVYQILPHGLSRLDEEIYFLAATLAAFDRSYLEGKPAVAGNLGATLARLAKGGAVNADAIDRRFRILLDARWEPNTDGQNGDGGEMPFRLRQMVRLVLSKQESIDWPQLLYDLRRWNHSLSPRVVQKEWARSFYGFVPVPTNLAGASGPSNAEGCEDGNSLDSDDDGLNESDE